MVLFVLLFFHFNVIVYHSFYKFILLPYRFRKSIECGTVIDGNKSVLYSIQILSLARFLVDRYLAQWNQCGNQVVINAQWKPE